MKSGRSTGDHFGALFRQGVTNSVPEIRASLSTVVHNWPLARNVRPDELVYYSCLSGALTVLAQALADPKSLFRVSRLGSSGVRSPCIAAQAPDSVCPTHRIGYNHCKCPATVAGREAIQEMSV